MTADQVTAELQRLVPVPWQWEVKEHGVNSFLAAFPDAMELARMDEFGFGEAKINSRSGIRPSVVWERCPKINGPVVQ